MTPYLDRAAMISPCQKFRYVLRRRWATEPLFQVEPSRGDLVTFLMLNPSTADADVDDPTLAKCVAMARRWGYAGLVLVNLFAFRSKEPTDLWLAADPIGPENDQHIADACIERVVVCAWGATVSNTSWAVMRQRPLDVMATLRADPTIRTRHLGLTKDKQPRHPLYLRGDTLPQRFQEGAGT